MTPERELRDLIAKWRKNGNATRSIKIPVGWTIGKESGQPTAAGCSMLTCADELEKLLTAAPAPTPAPSTRKHELSKWNDQQCKNCGLGIGYWPSKPKCAPAEPVVPEREPQDIGDEINQCLQIILTNAGNIQCFELNQKERDEDLYNAACAIEKAVDRAAKAVRALVAAPRAAGGQRPPRTVGCTANADCIHECPENEPEARLDEFKTAVIALCGELSSEEKKLYVATRCKELRDLAAPPPASLRAEEEQQ